MLLSEIAEKIIEKESNLSLENEVIVGKREEWYEESLIDPLIDYYSYDVLRVCGCGCPNDTLDVIRKYLHIRKDWKDNNYASVNCMCGMAFEKYKALTYPYPSIVDKIEKYGCDPKQLHHILRLKDFIERYCNGESYRTILIPKNKDMLLDIKSNYHYELEYSKNLAKETCEWIKQYKQEYMENNPLEINTEAKDVMEKVMTNLITFSIKNEVCRNE